MGARGFYGIGIVGTKTAANVGTLWRSAHSLGAGFIFTAGRRFPQQASDTVRAWKSVPMFEYEDGGDLLDHIPYSCVPVAVELDPLARPLWRYTHPERAVYILGAEDKGLPRSVMDRCRDVVVLPGDHCLNVATAGSIVMYDRLQKQERLDRLYGAERRFFLRPALELAVGRALRERAVAAFEEARRLPPVILP